MTQRPSHRTQVFISYSHADKDYMERLEPHLRPHVRQGAIPLWVDTQITPGESWYEKIEQGLATAKVAILLVSVDFLASAFIAEKELPQLLAAAQEEGVPILPVIVTPCLFRRSKLSHFQAVNDPKKALSEMTQSEQDRVWEQVVEYVLEALKAPSQARRSEKALVEEARNLEKQFQANNYTGRSNGPDILEMKGEFPVVLSAPHAVRCGRKVQKEPPQVYTGALALQVASLTGASGLVSARTSDEDPNRDEPGLFKPKLATLIKETRACFVLDLHGSDGAFVREKSLDKWR